MKNNKGFSLVELIIVIAIMAILIGVLAPQYLKYVEKSRVSADKDTLDSVYNAMTTAASDPDVTAIPGNGSSSAGFPGTAGNAGTWTAEVYSTLGISSNTSLKFKSKSAGNGTAGANGSNVSWCTDANGNFTVQVGQLVCPEK